MAQTSSRRAFLTAGSAILASAGAAVPAVANAPDPVLAAIEARALADQNANSTMAAHEKAWDRFRALGGMPAYPEAIYQTERDRLTFHFYAAGPEEDDGRRQFQPTFINYLRRNPPIRMVSRDGRDVREPWPEARERALEIIAAWDAWEAEYALRRTESGLVQAQTDSERANNAVCEAGAAVARTPATTAEGIVAKAAVVMAMFGDLGEVEAEIADMCVADAVALSVVRDVLALKANGVLA